MKDVSATPYAQRLLELHLPRYGEIPRIDLYMDQLVGFLEETLAPLYQPDEKIITRSMVNNYVKQGVLAAATGKVQYLQGKSDFLDTYAVFVENDGTNYYHTYNCNKFLKESFWIYSRKLAENYGFTPCPSCCK